MLGYVALVRQGLRGHGEVSRSGGLRSALNDTSDVPTNTDLRGLRLHGGSFARKIAEDILLPLL